ncbi:mitochondrial membrane protein [Pleodorina starrii]|uniref:Mitochondrial membrane protein n=1 Tax=Pleodorina starrii TaxID=330485 RepID=A0A9W6F7H6_9CHLO|nr:mitochondrial membrane protein [Pleodorina starrii]GLC59337.1 mitochondrial membrane protein [Pleodorina starrii]GLC74464.1 mitochondrial membrane protein [Pleodorina starrii]
MFALQARALGQAPVLAQPLLQLARNYSGWATVDPEKMSGSAPASCRNLVGGRWVPSASSRQLPDPMNGEQFLGVPHTQPDEIGPFVQSLRSVPKSGLHNPLKEPQRYLLYGDVSFRVAAEMRKPEVEHLFARLIQRVAPKSLAQALGEVRVTRKFFENFGGDQVRFLARGFTNPGDHPGQTSSGTRWPYGPVALITPFNFPLEIPALQLMGALYMGNKPLLHVDQRVSVVAEQLLRLLHHCGMPTSDVDLLHGPGATMGEVIRAAEPRSTLFTGSQRVAERLAVETHGKVFLEDAGFDWKILGPDVRELDYVAWQCDQDAYACSGQKCSAQSILFAHSNWVSAGLLDRLAAAASRRRLSDLTVGPVLSWTTGAILEHTKKLLAIPGAKLLFGGKPLSGHSIPEVYGAVEPTAVFVPLDQALKAEHFPAVTTEVFGPFQVVTEWRDDQLPLVLSACERMSHHLTAAVVSNDISFVQHVLAHTVNGTTYAGIRARTTGAPQNHWFGPAGDPRGAGIGTPEAIRLVWSCHREIITDFGPVPPAASLVQS